MFFSVTNQIAWLRSPATISEVKPRGQQTSRAAECWRAITTKRMKKRLTPSARQRWCRLQGCAAGYLRVKVHGTSDGISASVANWLNIVLRSLISGRNIKAFLRHALSTYNQQLRPCPDG